MTSEGLFFLEDLFPLLIFGAPKGFSLGCSVSSDVPGSKKTGANAFFKWTHPSESKPFPSLVAPFLSKSTLQRRHSF